MQRRAFDRGISWVGVGLTALLIVGGSLLTWAHNYTTNEVHDQLAAQQIVFPAKGSEALTALPAADRKAMEQYAGQLMTRGDQAETYADHFIAVHLKGIGGGQTYSQLSAKSLAAPTDTKLAAQVETMFKGETLRGLLLNAYAFGKMGTIAGIGAIVVFVGGGILLVLSALGLWHAHRTPRERTVFDGRHEAISPAATA
jgi:hypothetical protein